MCPYNFLEQRIAILRLANGTSKRDVHITLPSADIFHGLELPASTPVAHPSDYISPDSLAEGSFSLKASLSAYRSIAPKSALLPSSPNNIC